MSTCLEKGRFCYGTMVKAEPPAEDGLNSCWTGCPVGLMLSVLRSFALFEFFAVDVSISMHL